MALAKVGTKHVAYVADEDAKAILTFDLDAPVDKQQVASTSLDGTPSHVDVAPDGRVFVTLRDKNQVVALAAPPSVEHSLSHLCAAATPPEPIAMSMTPDHKTLLVTSGWGRRLVALDSATLATRFEVALPREPRSIVVADDGRSAFVSHAVGSIMSTIDLAKHEAATVPMRSFELSQMRALESQRQALEALQKKAGPLSPFEKQMKRAEEGRVTCQGFALAKSAAVPGRIFAPEVAVDPGDFEERPDGYGKEDAPTEIPAIAVLDEATHKPLMSSVMAAREPRFLKRRPMSEARDSQPECLLPRAATIDDKSKSVLVTCFGIDAVIAFDATAANPLAAERRRWIVGSGPSGVAVEPETHRGVVWSQFDRTLSTFPLDITLVDDHVQRERVQKVAAAPLANKVSADYALGRILFHAAGDTRISADGRACASCHPDGRDDAITWATPEGPRRSIMLAGRASVTPPYSWNGNETSLHNHLGNTFDRLSGKGLRSIELDALVAYVSQMPAPENVAPDSDAQRAKISRGKAVFMSGETGCSSCHSGDRFTDGKNHDVGSKHTADRGAAFNTPSLHLISGTGPYFHDGRYTSLTELLTKSDGQMGRTKHLSPTDLDALESYLRTL